MIQTSEILKRAKLASRFAVSLDTDKKNLALEIIANEILTNKDEILKANERDLEEAKGKISEVMLDRLLLNDKRILSMRDGIMNVKLLPDPCGKILGETLRNSMKIQKVSVPLGVVGIIYESRPNVTSDAAALTLKSGNVCILRSGKEAFRTSKSIVDIMRGGLKKAGLCEDFINIVEDTTRQSATDLMTGTGFIDLLIPRGGKGLIKSCVENATVPCIETGTGICHIYVEKSANEQMALDIIENAKTSRPSVCNAMECLIIDKEKAPEFLPKLYDRLVTKRKNTGLCPVQLRVDPQICGIIDSVSAAPEDFDTEHLDYILSVKAVNGIEEALDHIALHSTHHSESIITENPDYAKLFLDSVDSAAVYHNASTRFTDGGEFGLGCEMGISTQKLHARGPMGLEELCTYKYKIYGNGNIRG